MPKRYVLIDGTPEKLSIYLVNKLQNVKAYIPTTPECDDYMVMIARDLAEAAEVSLVDRTRKHADCPRCNCRIATPKEEKKKK